MSIRSTHFEWSETVKRLPVDLKADLIVFRRKRVEHFFFVSESEHRAAGVRQYAVDRAIVGEIMKRRTMRRSQHNEIRTEIH